MGYRLYVNELMQKQKYSLEETEEINRRLNAKLQELDDTISSISRLASQITDYPALALTAASPMTIKRFDLIYVDANTFIIVLMLSNNTVKSKLVHLPVSVDQMMVQKLNALFNSGFTGITEDQITPLLIHSTERAADDGMGLTSVIAAFAIETLSEAATPTAFVSGENRLLSQPEFRDPDKAHKLMSYLSGGGYILPPSEGESMGEDSEIRVLIGPENIAEELKDSSTSWVWLLPRMFSAAFLPMDICIMLDRGTFLLTTLAAGKRASSLRRPANRSRDRLSTSGESLLIR